MIRRRNEPYKGYLALPGGFVNEGERIEDAARREVNEETSLDICLMDILGVYSDPNRDPRGHLMSTVFVGMIPVDKDTEPVQASAHDHAAEIIWLNLESLENSDIALITEKFFLITKFGKCLGAHSGRQGTHLTLKMFESATLIYY